MTTPAADGPQGMPQGGSEPDALLSPERGAPAGVRVPPNEDTLLLRLAVEATGIGIFDYDVETGTLNWDARARALFGIGPEAPLTYAQTFLPALHRDDRARVDAALRAALDPAGPGTFDCECRIDAAGTPRWLAARGQLVTRSGRPIRLVGTVRDITETKTAEIALRATEERYRLVARATNDAIWDWDLVADTILWNEALTTAYGWTQDRIETTGTWWLAQIHPEDRAAVEADIRAVIAGGGEDWRHEYRFLRADGTYADVLDRGYMVRDAAGAPVRMIGAMLDITERNRVGAQFRAVFQGANIGIVQFDPRTVRAFAVNAKLCEIWGAPESEILGHSLARWTPPEDDTERAALHARLSSGQTMQLRLEKRYRRMDGRIIWARVNLVSQSLGDDVHATAMIEDITEEKRTEARREALIALSDRLRDLNTHADVVAATTEGLGRTLGVARAGYVQVDPGGAIVAITPDWTAQEPTQGPGTPGLLGAARTTLAASLTRLGRGEVLSVADIAATPERVDDPVAYARLGLRSVIKVPVLRRGRLVGILYALDDSPRDWSAGEIAFAREVAERAWGGLTRIEADEQQRILNRELSHRLKNTLSMVQAIASQTLRNVTDVEAAKEALAARLIALGKAHDILLSGAHESAEIEAVMQGALAIHDDRQPGRFRFSGPPITLGAKAALSLALMLHELATNAAKYGALSVPDGRVALDWNLEAGSTGLTVRMSWSETNGPVVTPPSQKGFGSRLIERGLVGAVGGAISLDYAPTGLVCRVVAPLAGFQGNS
jgi:PAS domain S-box-containing protein